MNSAASSQAHSSRLLSYLSLFTSLSTLLCCALPSLFVLLGLGASVASLLSFLPWLVTLSHYKNWTFAIAGILIAGSIFNVYYLAPKLRKGAECSSDDSAACSTADKTAKVLLWLSTALYALGFLVAYVLGPILTRMDLAN